MTYPEAVEYLYDRLPVFHRVGAVAYKPGLDNTLALLAALGNPHQQFRSIHVAGTNGKGSTSHLLASIYQSAGYRVGLYTSPHLKSFTERIRVNGQPIDEQAVAQFVGSNQAVIERLQPSFFEVTVAMAFAQFAQQRVDLAIVEVGLGGRLDSTNVITPELSVITNIGFDHTDLLGNTLGLIAGEKAGIIKPTVPVVIGERHTETQPVFDSVATTQQAEITYADTVWQCTDGGLATGIRTVEAARLDTPAPNRLTLQLPLLGLYQLNNLQTVLTAVTTVQASWPVADEAIEAGCRLVLQQTGLRGRFQPIEIPSSVSVSPPLVFADTAHNQPGLEALFATVQTIPHRQLHVVMGLVREKREADIWPLFPDGARYYFCAAHLPRALPVDELAEMAAQHGKRGATFADVNEALLAALASAHPDDLVLVTGSTYIVAELAYLD
ncbi:bifunctional folylpolyglutamate synthase/dihydrofolate synthase [Fibrella aquatilis]|uniref:Dihydrofolate synthase/folylpolyglutamate synthase n=1 Tax=Fibrella aquatilis TaxID=2817059 RepID=A0A939G470_9BACT|nr:folylpolyglutamate synthase/dihydrofolate synthase family protein [Fibrella aquatilis]MBO0929676.1 bifunctional folylpolyglutamate synthase/dihydrofolate synthase [Fibrella aquatilis]